MKDRASILARLRRWKRGAARYVVGTFAVAYLSAGVAPCVMATTRATDGMHATSSEHVGIAHEHHAHGVGVATQDVPAPADHDRAHCPHCPPGTNGHDAACFALEGLTNVAASHAKDASQSVTPALVAAVFAPPPPPAASWPPPPLRVARVTSVPLNVRHCIFLI